jgi:hypothetical protein
MPPSADVHPRGAPGVVAEGIAVERTVDHARIESVDRAAPILTLSVPGFRPAACNVPPGVLDWNHIQIGDRVRATMKESLTVYIAPALAIRSPDARVRDVDPSYRLLTLQSPSGETQTFKVRLHTPMDGIEPGDSVLIHPLELTEIRVRHDGFGKESFRPVAASAR